MAYLINQICKNLMLMLMAFFFAVSSFSVVAQNTLPDCFAYAKLAAPAGKVSTEIFVAIDQTTPLGQSLQQSVANNIKPFLLAGNAFSIMQFSAFTQGHYTDVLVSAKLSPVISEHDRNAIGKQQLAKFDQCMNLQGSNSAQLAGAALKKAFLGTSSDVAKSDVMASLKDISVKVMHSDAQEKIVLIVSDMLENSSVSSFYAKQAVRKIDPVKELALAEDNQLLGDFAGARIYVLGAGLVTEDAKQPKGVYRDPKTMSALQQFWREYFQKSNGQLVEFGQPALLNPLR